MSLADEAGTLADYTRWADERVLAKAAGIPGVDLDRELLRGLPSLRQTFEHMLGTQLHWFALWTGSEELQPDLSTFGSLRDAYAASHARLISFARGLTDAGWERREQWWRRWNSVREMELGRTFLQVLTHGSQHRSEIAAMLTALNQSPGDLDFLNYLAANPDDQN